MAKNFFELLGFSSDELADTMPEKIVQAFHDKGKDGVRVLMYEEMAKKLSAPLHIYNCDADGQPKEHPDVYGTGQPREPVKLIREPTDLYRRYGEQASSPEEFPETPAGGAAPAQPRKRTGGGGGGGTKTTGPEAWNARFNDLAEFVAKNGFRPRRTAEIDAERHLHYWMGQQQRKLGHNELPRDQAEKLQQLLDATKGKKAGEGGGGGRKAGTSSRRSSQGAAAASAAAADDDGDDNDEQE